ncbi:TOX high mobility group box family member 3-like [Centruroides sculpturatus]|uniref:TOX high mobility group box family member 3-like n=1 Tax=Centruroides sculpturatus TaxID=218467 RepID=UPI000C6EB7BC|nr:TOX high mobility group box family member 3-like [Centruroides sculpturatus]
MVIEKLTAPSITINNWWSFFDFYLSLCSYYYNCQLGFRLSHRLHRCLLLMSIQHQNYFCCQKGGCQRFPRHPPFPSVIKNPEANTAFLFQPADNFDLSLNISEDDCSATRQRSGAYMSLDQTFHTPSFGDEEFDIPPLQLPPADHQAATGEADVYRRPPSGAPPNSAVDSSAPSADPLDSGYVSAAASEASADRSDVRPGARDYGLPPPPRYPDPAEARRPPPGRTRTPSEACRSPVGATAVHPSPADSVHASPGLETSEDSDDSTPLSQLMGSVKRPSPEPPERAVVVKSSVAKKPKPQKKKKKRDPNEPQK